MWLLLTKKCYYPSSQIQDISYYFTFNFLSGYQRMFAATIYKNQSDKLDLSHNKKLLISSRD